MANLFVKTGGDLSGLTYQKVVYNNFNPPYTTSHTGSTALNTERTIAFTPSDAGDCEGVLLHLKLNAVNGAQSVTVKLQENVASVWTDRASKTLTYEEVCGTLSSTFTGVSLGAPYLGGFTKYFEFTSPYTIDTSASKWRISIQSTDANCLVHTASSTGYTALVTLSNTLTYTSGDNVYLNHGITITVDESKTFGNICLGADSKLNWDTTPASSYTLTATNLYFAFNSRFEVGESATPIPYAQQATITITNYRGLFIWGGHMPYYVYVYGEKPTDFFSTSVGVTANAQKKLVIADDFSASWVATDVIRVFSSRGTHEYAIDSISGTEITTTANITGSFSEGFIVENVTRSVKCGVSLGANITLAANTGVLSGCEISGLYRNTKSVAILVVYGGQGSGGNGESTANTLITPVKYSHIFGGVLATGTGVANYTTNTLAATMANYYSGFEAEYCFSAHGGQSSQFVANNVVGATINQIHAGGYLNTVTINSTNGTITNISATPNWVGYNAYYSVTVNGASNTFTNLRVRGVNVVIQGVENRFVGCYFDASTRALELYGNCAGFAIEDCVFGRDMPNTYTVGFIDGTFGQLDFVGCSTNDTNDVYNIAGAVGSSRVSFAEYDEDGDDHKVYKVYGNFQSTGDGLTDTTVHTSGTGKFALRFEPMSSTNNLEWEFTVPTGNIQNKTMTVFMWVKINSATYYAGTHQNPRLTIDYDNGTTAYAEATDSTAWQLLTVSFTPTTSYGQITATVSGKTDATSTDAYFYIDDFGVSYPPSVALDLGGLDNWANALPVTPPIALPLSAGTVAQNVWTQLSTTSWGTNTMGEKVKKPIKYIVNGEIPL